VRNLSLSPPGNYDFLKTAELDFELTDQSALNAAPTGGNPSTALRASSRSTTTAVWVSQVGVSLRVMLESYL